MDYERTATTKVDSTFTESPPLVALLPKAVIGIVLAQ
jgi:hypothetical protein